MIRNIYIWVVIMFALFVITLATWVNNTHIPNPFDDRIVVLTQQVDEMYGEYK